MAAVAPLVISALGAVYAGHEANKQRQLQHDQMKKQEELLKPAAESGKLYTQQAQSAIGPTLNYYTTLLSGNRSAMQEAMAPELNSIAKSYAGSAAATRGLYPRGGTSPSAAGNLRYQELGDINNTLYKARPMAANALGSLGTNLAGLGYQGLGLSAGISSNIFNQGMQARQQQFGEGQAAGQGLFNAYQAYLLSRSMSGGGSGSGGGGGYSGPGLFGAKSPYANSGIFDPQWGGYSGHGTAFGGNSSVPNSGSTSGLYTPPAGGKG